MLSKNSIDNTQKALLKIVRTWIIKLTPEYRGFRCADCQKYIHKAWHHFLNYGGFKTPVHFCNKCQRKINLEGGKLKPFTCDKCGRNMYKSFHVWRKVGETMIETHYCKRCLGSKGDAFRG